MRVCCWRKGVEGWESWRAEWSLLFHMGRGLQLRRNLLSQAKSQDSSSHQIRLMHKQAVTWLMLRRTDLLLGGGKGVCCSRTCGPKGQETRSKRRQRHAGMSCGVDVSVLISFCARRWSNGDII